MLRGSRVFTFAMTMIIVVLLISFSTRGSLGPFEDVVAVPLTFVQEIIGGATQSVSRFVDDVSNFRKLQRRNQDLEEALAVYQSALAELREKGQDYDRLAALLDYDRQGAADRQYVTCDVIGRDTSGFVRVVQLDCGRRDGVDVLDPVVTELGLVGRVTKVSATGSEVLMVTDPTSSINTRLQSTRQDGRVVGQLAGDLVMTNIDVDTEVVEGDLVVTNGLGQTLPADLVVGQVLSVALAESELYQEARVRSLVDVDRLEIVQVIINFEPVDLSVFEEQEAANAP